MYPRPVLVFALAVLFFLPLYAHGVSAAGVTICNVNYDCGVSDGVCPTDYGANCVGTCDSDCAGGTCACVPSNVSVACQPSASSSGGSSCISGKCTINSCSSGSYTGKPCSPNDAAATGQYYCNASVCGDCLGGKHWDGSKCIPNAFSCDINTANKGISCGANPTVSAPYYCGEVDNLCYSCGAGKHRSAGVCVLDTCGVSGGSPCDGTTTAASSQYYCSAGTCADCTAGKMYRAADNQCVLIACGATTACTATETCANCRLDCGPCIASSISSISANPASGTQTNGSNSFDVTIIGTIDPANGPMTLSLNNPPGLILQSNPPGLSKSGLNSGDSFSATFTAPLPGTYTFTATETDASGSRTTTWDYVVLSSNTPPQVALDIISNTSTISKENVNYRLTIMDDKPGTAWTFKPGNGNFSYGTCQSTLCVVYPPTATYSAGSPTNMRTTTSLTGMVTSGAPIVADANATDSNGATGSNSTPLTPIGLDPVTGTPDGNATYNNNASECASDACAAQKAGWWSCFSINSCYPDNTTACGTPSNPPQFTDRDTDKALCEMGSNTCKAYVYTSYFDRTQINLCCTEGNASRNIPIKNYGGVQNTTGCCPIAGQVFTTAGNHTGCYGGAENTPALCRDGEDNDADGLVDALDPDCNAQSLNGTVTLKEANGGTTAGLGAQVSLDGIKKDTYLCTINGENKACFSFVKGELQKGAKTIIASKTGYAVGYVQQTLDTNGQYTIDFTLSARRCNADCTNDQGLCDYSCIGVGNCTPTAPEIETLRACHPVGAPFGLRKGTEIQIASNESNQSIETAVCCTVPGTWRNAPKTTTSESPGFSGSIDTLVKYTSIVYIYGRPYRLVVNTW